MTRSNRILNRAIIAVAGLLLLAAGGYIINASAGWLDLPTLSASNVTALWITAGGALVVVVLSVLWIVSRGRGRTRTLVTRVDASGMASVEARVAADFITEDVSRIADVVSVAATAFRTRGSVTLELRVTTRRAADVRRVIDGVGRAVAELDGVLEERVPVVLHVASGVRASLAREQRVR